MARRRMERTAEAVRHELSEIIIHEMRDPRLGFVTVTRVEVSSDARYASVYLSILGDEKKQKLTYRALLHAKGFLQSELAARWASRYVPLITLHYDESPRRAVDISSLIDEALADGLQTPVEEQSEADVADVADEEPPTDS